MLLQQMDYLGFIDVYHERIGAFHVKDGRVPGPARGKERRTVALRPGSTGPGVSVR